ncbi:trehalose-6-phosphate synthase [Bradyrhizobium sp. USDA 4473]
MGKSDESQKLGFKHHAKVHSFRIGTAILTWVLLGAVLFYKPEWIRDGMRAGTRAIETVGDALPGYWGAQAEIVLRELLSKFAGAAEDFNENEALLVDPNHPQEIAAAISKAANMPLEERVTRWRSMMDKIESFTIHDWSADNVRELDKSRATVPADQFHRLGLGWTNEAQMPLFRRHAEALATYNEIDPADAALKEAAFEDEKKAYEALEASLIHTQDRLWNLPVDTAPIGVRPEQEPGAGED